MDPSNKEVVNPIQPNQKNVPYTYAGKLRFREVLKKFLPESAHPTKKTPKILGIIFLIVVIIGVFQFPFTGMLSGNVNVEISIGVPLVFLEFKLYAPEENPIRIGNMAIDVLIYVFLAYLIDIGINVVLHMRLLKSEEEKKQIPKMYKDVESRNTSEKVTSGIFKKN